MGENDLLALRYLLKAQREGRLVSPHELARYLGVSTASMTAMVHRLEESGHVRREPHRSDRRSVVVVATQETDEEVRRTLGEMHTRMLDAVIDMSPEESSTVIECLTRLQAALDAVQPADAPDQADAAHPRDAAHPADAAHPRGCRAAAGCRAPAGTPRLRHGALRARPRSRPPLRW